MHPNQARLDLSKDYRYTFLRDARTERCLKDILERICILDRSVMSTQEADIFRRIGLQEVGREIQNLVLGHLPQIETPKITVERKR